MEQERVREESKRGRGADESRGRWLGGWGVWDVGPSRVGGQRRGLGRHP